MDTTIRIRKNNAFSGDSYRYPLFSICLCFSLVLLTPFITGYLSLAVFAICLYRMVRYDVVTFSIDYCVLFPLLYLFRVPGTASLHYYLCLIAAIWFFVKGRFYKLDASFIGLVLLSLYLLLRMDTQISNYIICLGQLLLIYILSEKIEEGQAVIISKAFIYSVIASSVYAFIFRSSYRLSAYIDEEASAFWGSSLGRFRGLFDDPNYYMSTIVISLALLIKLRMNGVIKTTQFMLLSIMLSLFGMLSYSKSFFVIFIALVLIFIVILFIKRKFASGIAFLLAGIVIFILLLENEASPLAIIFYRLSEGSGLSDLTTGRSDLFIRYFKEIIKSPVSLFFGGGFDSPILEKATHNLFLEFTYYTGLIGLILYVFFFAALIRRIAKRMSESKQFLLLKFIVLIACVLIFITLHGMFTEIPYVFFFLAVSSMLISSNKVENVGDTKKTE